MKLRFGLIDLLLILTFACLSIGPYANKSPIAFGVGMNVVLVILFFTKPLADRASVHSRLLLFPATWVELIVMIAIIVVLNLLFWLPA